MLAEFAHSTELEYITEPIVNYAVKSTSINFLINSLVHLELERSVNVKGEEGGQLIGVSFAARVTSSYISHYSPESSKCLSTLLDKTLKKILEKPGCLSIKSEKDVSELKFLLEILEELSKNVLKLKDLPEELKTIGEITGRAAKKYGSESSLGTLACEWFLSKFLNPALGTPQNYGLLKGVTIKPKSLKDLINITKLIQKLVSGTHYKEEYMNSVNEKITEMKKKLVKYFEKIFESINEENFEKEEKAVFVPLAFEKVSDDDLGNFFSIFTNHSVSMLRSLANDESSSDRELFHLLHNTLLYQLTYNIKYYIQVNLFLEDERRNKKWLDLLVEVTFFLKKLKIS